VRLALGTLALMTGGCGGRLVMRSSKVGVARCVDARCGSVWPERMRTGVVAMGYEARVSTTFGCGKKLMIVGLLFIGNLASNRSPCRVLTILSTDGNKLVKFWEYFERV
jgi:hypothetical protein